MDTDHLRDKIADQKRLAQVLFEAQFELLGGRKPADPTWDDLEPSEQDRYWDEARRVEHILGSISTEWGVRWPSGYVAKRASEAEVWALVAMVGNAEPVEIVSRTVMRTEWRAVDLNAEGGGSDVRSDA